VKKRARVSTNCSLPREKVKEEEEEEEEEEVERDARLVEHQ